MDVHGLNPKQNKKIDEFPIYKKIKDIEDSGNYNKRHELLDGDNDLRKKYYDEWSEYEDTNIGTYFRNNCWWWRPLWDFCAEVAPDIISAELWQSGHLKMEQQTHLKKTTKYNKKTKNTNTLLIQIMLRNSQSFVLKAEGLRYGKTTTNNQRNDLRRNKQSIERKKKL